MANVAQLNLTERGAEARLRALIEDLAESFKGPSPESKLALSVWFNKEVQNSVHEVLVLWSGVPISHFGEPFRVSLRWRTGEDGPPFVRVNWTSVDYFSKLLTAGQIEPFRRASEVLAFNKSLLNEAVMRAFNIVTEPSGLIKGWYVDFDQYERLKSANNLLSSYSHLKPQIGLVKTYDPPDAENCRGLLHVEVSHRWLPLSLSGLRIRTFFNDLQQGRPGVFLFQGGAIYRPLKFEEKNEPEYSKLVLESLPDDRYPEVYLRSVHPSEQPAA